MQSKITETDQLRIADTVAYVKQALDAAGYTLMGLDVPDADRGVGVVVHVQHPAGGSNLEIEISAP